MDVAAIPMRFSQLPAKSAFTPLRQLFYDGTFLLLRHSAVMGRGGIATAADALEMLMAGATAVEVGAANLVDPFACKRIVEALPGEMERYGIESLAELGNTDLSGS